MQTWVIYTGASVIGIGLGALIVSQTSWWKVRMYAIKLKKVFDKHKVQEKAEAVQSLGQNPNPVLLKRPLKELVEAYKGLIEGLEKIKAPKKAKEVHEETLTLHRESMSLYQMLLVGGYRQKTIIEKQKRLQQLERSVNEKMEKLYGQAGKKAKEAKEAKEKK